MKISLLQTDIELDNIDLNLVRAEELFPSDADLVVLPEMFHCGFSSQMDKVQQSSSQQALEWMKRMAATHSCHVCGSIVWHEADKAFNRLYCVSPDGSESHYDKRHLFSMGNEHLQFASGNERVVVTICGVRILLLICYDLRFPVWSRNTGDYDAIIYVANWPAARRDVWTTLLKARAIENQCYVAGVNRVGTSKGIAYSGNSVIFGPRGEVVAQALTEEPEIVSGDFNTDMLSSFRSKFRVLDDADSFEITL